MILISQIPGFGDQLMEHLLKWRRHLERRLRFNPKSVDTDNSRGRGRTGLKAEEVRYLMAVLSLDGMLRRLVVLSDTLEKQRAAVEPRLKTLSEDIELLKDGRQRLG